MIFASLPSMRAVADQQHHSADPRLPTASWDWHRIWPALTGHYRLVAMDMLGFGFSRQAGATSLLDS
jgi:pimeloyl-ACP methyl ester carboxylesterase